MKQWTHKHSHHRVKCATVRNEGSRCEKAENTCQASVSTICFHSPGINDHSVFVTSNSVSLCVCVCFGLAFRMNNTSLSSSGRVITFDHVEETALAIFDFDSCHYTRCINIQYTAIVCITLM